MAAAGRGRLFSAAGRGRERAGGIGCGAPPGVPAAIASAAIAARCSARRPRSRRIATATSAWNSAAALTQKSVVLLQITSGPQKLRPASPVVMIRAPMFSVVPRCDCTKEQSNAAENAFLL